MEKYLFLSFDKQKNFHIYINWRNFLSMNLNFKVKKKYNF